MSRKRPCHGGTGTRLHNIWKGLFSRCYNPKNQSFKHYGEKGIGVCREWCEFAPFRDWAFSNGYRDDLTIERLDNEVGYEPGNCTWIPRCDQAINKDRTMTNEEGVPYCRIALSNGIERKTFDERVHGLGWSPEKAATHPVRRVAKAGGGGLKRRGAYWEVAIFSNGRSHYVGRYKSEAAAVEARDTARIHLATSAENPS